MLPQNQVDVGGQPQAIFCLCQSATSKKSTAKAGMPKHSRRIRKLIRNQAGIRAGHPGAGEARHNPVNPANSVRQRCLRHSLWNLDFAFRHQHDPEKDGGIRHEMAALQIGVPQVVGQPAHHPGRILEDQDIEDIPPILRLVALNAPRQGGSRRETQVARGKILEMSAITPVCIQESRGTMFDPVFRRVQEVRQAIIRPAGEAVPR